MSITLFHIKLGIVRGYNRNFSSYRAAVDTGSFGTRAYSQSLESLLKRFNPTRVRLEHLVNPRTGSKHEVLQPHTGSPETMTIIQS